MIRELLTIAVDLAPNRKRTVFSKEISSVVFVSAETEQQNQHTQKSQTTKETARTAACHNQT
jgi:hypothetical protein